MKTLDVYLQIAPNRSYSGEYIYSLSLARATGRKPRRRVPDTVLLKLRVSIPDAAFGALSAEVAVPSSVVQPVVRAEEL